MRSPISRREALGVLGASVLASAQEPPLRFTALDGIPRHLPSLLRVEKLVKKARKAKLLDGLAAAGNVSSKKVLANKLFDLAAYAQSKGWSAEELLRTETRKQELRLRRIERHKAG